MTIRFDGQVAIVTGAGRGLGRSHALALAERGTKVVVNDLGDDSGRSANADAVVAEIIKAGGEAIANGANVANFEQVQGMVKQAMDAWGRVDILINNAAENVLAPVSEYTDEDWDRGIAVNFTGCFYLTRRVLPGMMERGWGSIVNVTSVAAWLSGGGREGPYASAKAALHSLTRAVAFEGGPRGVRCNAVAPGIIWSKFVRRYEKSFRDEIEKTPLRRIGEPTEVADAVVFLVSEQSSFITGEVLNVSGGWYMHA